MRILDFFSRRVEAPPEPPPAPAATPTSQTPEDIIDAAWVFPPDDVVNGQRRYDHQTIQSVALIYQARALGQIAEDLAAIRKHLTRLQLVDPPPAQLTGGDDAA